MSPVCIAQTRLLGDNTDGQDMDDGTLTTSMTVPTVWSTAALPPGVGVPTTVGSAPGVASKVTAWTGRAATNDAASRVAVAAFRAPVFRACHSQALALSLLA